MRFLVVLAVLCPAILNAHDPVSTKLTWSQEISRIVYKRCSGCHREGGSAMSLTTYEAARPWAKAIKEEVLNRRMPPWGAVKGFGDFRDDAGLTQDEMTRLAEWVEGGAPEGEPVYLPPVPKQTDGPALPAGRRVRSLKRAATLLGIRPLASAESARATAHHPDGSVTPLIWLRQYDSRWNRTFVFRQPVSLPAGTVIRVEPPVALEYLIAK